jgi:hypothetical protein
VKQYNTRHAKWEQRKELATEHVNKLGRELMKAMLSDAYEDIRDMKKIRLTPDVTVSRSVPLEASHANNAAGVKNGKITVDTVDTHDTVDRPTRTLNSGVFVPLIRTFEEVVNRSIATSLMS